MVAYEADPKPMLSLLDIYWYTQRPERRREEKRKIRPLFYHELFLHHLVSLDATLEAASTLLNL